MAGTYGRYMCNFLRIGQTVWNGIYFKSSFYLFVCRSMWWWYSKSVRCLDVNVQLLLFDSNAIACYGKCPIEEYQPPPVWKVDFHQQTEK